MKFSTGYYLNMHSRKKYRYAYVMMKFLTGYYFGSRKKYVMMKFSTGYYFDCRKKYEIDNENFFPSVY